MRQKPKLRTFTRFHNFSDSESSRSPSPSPSTHSLPLTRNYLPQHFPDLRPGSPLANGSRAGQHSGPDSGSGPGPAAGAGAGSGSGSGGGGFSGGEGRDEGRLRLNIPHSNSQHHLESQSSYPESPGVDSPAFSIASTIRNAEKQSSREDLRRWLRHPHVRPLLQLPSESFIGLLFWTLVGEFFRDVYWFTLRAEGFAGELFFLAYLFVPGIVLGQRFLRQHLANRPLSRALLIFGGLVGIASQESGNVSLWHLAVGGSATGMISLYIYEGMWAGTAARRRRTSFGIAGGLVLLQTLIFSFGGRNPIIARWWALFFLAILPGVCVALLVLFEDLSEWEGEDMGGEEYWASAEDDGDLEDLTMLSDDYEQGEDEEDEKRARALADGRGEIEMQEQPLLKRSNSHGGASPGARRDRHLASPGASPRGGKAHRGMGGLKQAGSRSDHHSKSSRDRLLSHMIAEASAVVQNGSADLAGKNADSAARAAVPAQRARGETLRDERGEGRTVGKQVGMEKEPKGEGGFDTAEGAPVVNTRGNMRQLAPSSSGQRRPSMNHPIEIVIMRLKDGLPGDDESERVMPVGGPGDRRGERAAHASQAEGRERNTTGNHQVVGGGRGPDLDGRERARDSGSDYEYEFGKDLAHQRNDGGIDSGSDDEDDGHGRGARTSDERLRDTGRRGGTSTSMSGRNATGGEMPVEAGPRGLGWGERHLAERPGGYSGPANGVREEEGEEGEEGGRRGGRGGRGRWREGGGSQEREETEAGADAGRNRWREWRGGGGRQEESDLTARGGGAGAGVGRSNGPKGVGPGEGQPGERRSSMRFEEGEEVAWAADEARLGGGGDHEFDDVEHRAFRERDVRWTKQGATRTCQMAAGFGSLLFLTHWTLAAPSAIPRWLGLSPWWGLATIAALLLGLAFAAEVARKLLPKRLHGLVAWTVAFAGAIWLASGGLGAYPSTFVPLLYSAEQPAAATVPAGTRHSRLPGAPLVTPLGAGGGMHFVDPRLYARANPSPSAPGSVEASAATTRLQRGQRANSFFATPPPPPASTRGRSALSTQQLRHPAEPGAEPPSAPPAETPAGVPELAPRVRRPSSGARGTPAPLLAPPGTAGVLASGPSRSQQNQTQYRTQSHSQGPPLAPPPALTPAPALAPAPAPVPTGADVTGTGIDAPKQGRRPGTSAPAPAPAPAGTGGSSSGGAAEPATAGSGTASGAAMGPPGRPAENHTTPSRSPAMERAPELQVLPGRAAPGAGTYLWGGPLLAFATPSLWIVMARNMYGVYPGMGLALATAWYLLLATWSSALVAWRHMAGLGWLRSSGGVLIGCTLVGVGLGLERGPDVTEEERRDFGARLGAWRAGRLTWGSGVPDRKAILALAGMCAFFLFFALCARGIYSPPSRPGAPLQGAGQLRVVSFNVQQGFSRTGLNNFDAIRAMLRELQPHVVLLQETDLMHIVHGNLDLVDFLSTWLGMHSLYNPPTRAGTWGCAILSVYPFATSGFEVLPSPAGENACFQHAVIRMDGGELHVMNAHFGDEARDVAEQAERVSELVHGASSSAPSDAALDASLPNTTDESSGSNAVRTALVLGGDFNVSPLTPAYEALLSAGLYDTRVSTFGPYKSPEDRDPGAGYILASQSLVCTSWQEPQYDQGATSDGFPLVASFTLATS